MTISCRPPPVDGTTVLDYYGATNKAEFFAVATETFFEQPIQLRQQQPELYDALRVFYGQDPAQRLTVPQQAAPRRSRCPRNHLPRGARLLRYSQSFAQDPVRRNTRNASYSSGCCCRSWIGCSKNVSGRDSKEFGLVPWRRNSRARLFPSTGGGRHEIVIVAAR